MPLQLRAYQADLAKRAAKALEKSKSVVVQLETGAGKTHIAASMCRTWGRQKKRVWFIAHRQEILSQAEKTFAEAGVSHGPGKRVEFRMITAAAKASGQEPAPDVLIFDECHHAPAKTWAGVIKAAPNALRLGLTATPGRLDGAPLSDFFAEIVEGPSPKELRDAGHLARYRYFAPVIPDLSGVKVRKGEYDRSQAVEVMTGAAIVGDVVEHYQRHAAGKRAILFAVSVEASEEMARRFNGAGIAALHVDAKTPDDERAAAIAAFRQGKVKVLCNVELFTEGFDLPAIDAVILLRPTRSLALFRQMLGRGARPSGRNKTIILDHAACVVEHGLPDETYVWTLDGEPPRRKREIDGGERTRMRRCPKCSAVHEWADACPECGHEYSGARDLTEIGGSLKEMTRPPGFLTVAEFAKYRGVVRSAPWNWIKAGMPFENGFIDKQKADDWILHRDLRTKAEKSEIMSKKWSIPEWRKKIAAGNTEKFSDPEHRSAASARMKANRLDPEFKAKEIAGKMRWVNSRECHEHLAKIGKMGADARWGAQKAKKGS